MKRTNRLITSAVVAVIFFQCGPRIVDISQRGGSGTETVGIYGSAVDKNQNPVVGASVKLRRGDFLDTADKSHHEKGLFLADVTTDSRGKFHFGSVDTGAYCIEINDGSHNGAVVRCVVDTADSFFALPQAQLRPTGSIYGSIEPAPQTDSMKFSVLIYGLAGHNQTSAHHGEFTLAEIPSDTYTIKIVPHVPIYVPALIPISVTGGKVDTLSQVNMVPSRFSVYPPDSCAVRAILDSNGLFTTPVFAVAGIAQQWPFRITGLTIAYKNFTKLTPVVGRLTELRSIDIQGMRWLVSLPEEIGNCKKLRELTLYDNQIETLPSTIGDIDSLERLGLHGNRLENLPREIGRLQRLCFLDVGRNSLSSIPGEISLCRSLRTLMANDNFITDFSMDIGRFDDLQFIDLNENLLRTLPYSFASSHPWRQFSICINDNSLCELLPEEVASWLNMVSCDKNWRLTQVCH